MRQRMLWGSLAGFWLGLLWVCGGCTHHLPLDEVVESLPINGQITVNVFNGLTSAADAEVQVITPSGVIQTGYSGTSVTAGQVFGQVVFKESGTGMYGVSLAPASGLTPLKQCVDLTQAVPYADVTLQTQATYLSITAADNKPLSYDETQSYHTFNLTAESISLTNTVTVFYQSSQTSLPPGWQVILPTTGLESGQSVQLVVQTAPFTVFGNVTISVGAVCDSQALSVTPIVLSPAWTPMIQYDFLGSNSGTDINFLCVGCGNSGNTVQETLQMLGKPGFDSQESCTTTSSGPQTLTDALSVPDGNGPEFPYSGCASEPTLTFLTVFTSGLGYEFSIQPTFDGTDEAVTLTAAMLQAP